ncbi:MAG: energy-coupling factor transporter transmembrane protein EcfT [Thaumarchaeota archaeon]|nr:energy-coupling factor transporter transmembrane protein EcfT [Candidatus Calditenuaceae archaeon]
MSRYVLYAEGKSFFHSLDPRSKIALVVCVFVWSSVFNHPLYTGTVLGAVLALVLISGVASRLKLFWFGLVSLATMSLILWPLFRRGGENVLFEAMGIVFTQESVMYGLAVAFRLVAMVLSGLLLLTTTRIEDLELALTRLGMPYSMAFGISAVFRFIPAMVGDGLTILAAQRARGVNVVSGNVFSRMKNSAAIIVPLFITTMRRFGELPLAIESRGFVPMARRSYLLELRFRARDVVFTATVLFLAALSIYMRLNGYGVVFPHVI